MAASSRTETDQWYLQQLGSILQGVWRDRLPIALITLLIAITGGVAGKLTNSISSSAQLLLTPLPLRSATSEDPLSQMIPVPMEVKTATLLCMSDDAVERTRQKLNESGKLEEPIESLQDLRDALEYEITVAKETPYEEIYSPVIALTAEAKSPAEAKLLVDTWAMVCEELGREYKKKQSSSTVMAFQAQEERLRAKLEEAREALELFERERNFMYYDTRLTALVALVSDYVKEKAMVEQNLQEAKAKHLSMSTVQAGEEPILGLGWTPAAELANMVLPAGKKLAEAKAPEGTEAVTPPLLVQDTLNPLYDLASKESAIAEAGQLGFEARGKEIDVSVERFMTEMKQLQIDRAETQRKQQELMLEVTIATEAYTNASTKTEYALMAQELDATELQVLSPGAEWRMPRFRRALLFAGLAGAVAFSAAVLTSVFMRRFIFPALELT
ncbi:MAG: hypothetical protein HYV27_21800 [Candidatus Hydrogenedentes bacterium]|nr:hypothetical protein [Candidatus Hydrogenedentota bacterium]